ncbi:MAG: hypothetical protein DMF56_22090 [Acidobacteria bacterium]|nr:MAG: hypothetical protein DMF56_22090 [Acidobacteriota bacterium]
MLVLMPFDPAFDDEYKLAIKPACESAGAYAERVDEQISTDNILERIYHQIARADLLIAEMTGRNVNVLYETGYAHARDRPVILLAQNPDDIPAELRNFPSIIHHGRLTTLRSELEQEVRHTLAATREGEPSSTVPVEVTVNGVKLTAGDIGAVTDDIKEEQEAVELQVVIRNEPLRLVKPVDLQIGLITPLRFAYVESRSSWFEGAPQCEDIVIGSDARLHVAREPCAILPGSWNRISFFAWAKGPLPLGDLGTFTIRVFTTSGFFDFPMTVTTIAKVPPPSDPPAPPEPE